MRKTWLWTLTGMIGLAVVSYALFLWLLPRALPEGLIYGNGRIEATGVTVSAEVGGRVLESALVEGRTVQANDLPVRLDGTDLNTRLKQDEANATAAQRAQAHIELKIYVPESESEIGKVKLNDPARVRVDAFPQRYFEARVERVEQRAQLTHKDVHIPDERACLVFGVVGAIMLSRATLRKMHQNLWRAVSYNVVAFPLATGYATAGEVSGT